MSLFQLGTAGIITIPTGGNPLLFLVDLRAYRKFQSKVSSSSLESYEWKHDDFFSITLQWEYQTKKKSLEQYKRTLTSLFSQQQPSLIIFMPLAWLSL